MSFLVLVAILPFSMQGSNNNNVIEQNGNFQLRSTDKKEIIEESTQHKQLFKEIFDLAQVDNCMKINEILDNNPEILTKSFKVWLSIYNVRKYDEIPTTKYFSLLNKGLKGIKEDGSSYLRAMYYDAIGFCYCFGWEVPINRDTAAEYWKKGAALGFAESAYHLGLHQINQEDKKIDLTAFVQDILKQIIEINIDDFSSEKYKKNIKKILKSIVKENKNDEGEELFSPTEKEVAKQVLQTTSEHEHFINWVRENTSSNMIDLTNRSYKNFVQDKLESISETGKYRDEKIKKILNQHVEDEQKFRDIVQKFPKITKIAAERLELENRFKDNYVVTAKDLKERTDTNLKSIDENYQETIKAVINDLVDEMIKECLPNYNQSLQHIINAAKCGYPPAKEYIEKQHIIGTVEEYYNSDLDVIPTKERIINQLKNSKNEFIKNIFKYNMIDGVTLEGCGKRIDQYKQNRKKEIYKILHLLSKDFKSPKAQNMLAYEVYVYAKNVTLSTNCDLCIEAGEFLLGLGVAKKELKVRETSFKEVTKKVDVTQCVSDAYYGKAQISALAGDEKAEQYAQKSIALGNKNASNFLLELADCYAKGRAYPNSSKKFPQIPQKAIDLYIKLIDSKSEKSLDALKGVEWCIDFIMKWTDGTNYVYEDDIEVLEQKRRTIEKSQITGFNYYSLNEKFKQLRGWGNFNTALKLTSGKNEGQDLDKAQKMMENFLTSYKVSQTHTEKAKRYIEVLKNRVNEYKRLIGEVVTTDYPVEETLGMDKMLLCSNIAGEVMKKMNKHDIFGGYRGTGVGRQSIFIINAENKNEIDLLFKLFYQEGIMIKNKFLEEKLKLIMKEQKILEQKQKLIRKEEKLLEKKEQLMIKEQKSSQEKQPLVLKKEKLLENKKDLEKEEKTLKEEKQNLGDKKLKIMTEEVAIEVRKMLFPRDEDDEDTSEDNSDD